MHTYDLIFPFALIAVGITLRNIVLYHDQLSNKLTGSDGKWNFNDWATPLISITAGLSLIITLIQQNMLITSISILCGALILVLPLAFKALCEPAQRTWTFLVFALLMLWVVEVELVTAATIADDDIVKNLPALPIHTFRALMIIAAVIALIYYWKSSQQLLSEQATTPKEPVLDDTVAFTSRLMLLESVTGPLDH